MEKQTNFKSLTTKAKIGYIWDYYRWPILITIVLLYFIGSLVHHYVTYEAPLLNVLMMNTNTPTISEKTGFEDFFADYGYDANDESLALSSSIQILEENPSISYNDIQVLAAQIAAGGQDLFFGTGETYLSYCEQGACIDLSKVLSPETLNRYADSLIYSTDDGETEPYPCAIELKNNGWLSEYGYYDTCYFSILYAGQNQNTAAEFAEYLLNYDSHS